jgi:type IV secretion system protein TrbJ
MKRRLASILLATAIGVAAIVVPAHAQMAVFDSANFGQNVLTAAHTLQQITNQITQIQNEVTMLQNMGKNLSSLNTSQLSTMTSALTQIGNLMNQGNGIAFNTTATANAWNTSYPGSYPLGTSSTLMTSNAQARWQQAMAAYQQTLQVQAQVAQNVQADTTTMSSLVNTSQGAVGNLQVLQATNQLLALATKQVLQLQSLMAAQYRANSLDTARKAEDETAALGEYTNFLGTSQAYTPQ